MSRSAIAMSRTSNFQRSCSTPSAQLFLLPTPTLAKSCGRSSSDCCTNVSNSNFGFDFLHSLTRAHSENNSSHANERGRYFNKLLDIAPELDDPELLAAVVQVEGDGASLYFERAFKDSSALTSAQQEESEASEKRGASAPYVGLLVGGKRHATWAVELHNKPTLQRTGTDQPLISLAAAAHASKVRRMRWRRGLC